MNEHGGKIDNVSNIKKDKFTTNKNKLQKFSNQQRPYIQKRHLFLTNFFQNTGTIIQFNRICSPTLPNKTNICLESNNLSALQRQDNGS